MFRRGYIRTRRADGRVEVPGSPARQAGVGGPRSRRVDVPEGVYVGHVPPAGKVKVLLAGRSNEGGGFIAGDASDRPP